MCNQMEKTLDHLYSTHRYAYKALPRIQFGKWSDDTDATLQDCFASTDWNMFGESSNAIEEYTTSVISFSNKCIDNIVPTVTVRTYLNQKPWITGNICIELKARAAVFKERDTNPEAYKNSRYAL